MKSSKATSNTSLLHKFCGNEKSRLGQRKAEVFKRVHLGYDGPHVHQEYWNGDTATCGGTLISECWILTVANCTFSLSTESQVAALPNVLQHLDRYFMESEYVFQRTNSSCWELHKKFFDRLVHMDAVLLLHTKRILLKKRTQCESLLQKLRFLIVSGRKI